VVEANLAEALNYASRWDKAYQAAKPNIRQQMNQAIFKKVWVDSEGNITSEFTDTFAMLLSNEVTTAAEEHATLTQTDPDWLDRELASMREQWEREQQAKTEEQASQGALVDSDEAEYSNSAELVLAGTGAGKHKTPSRSARRGLSNELLVGLVGQLSHPSLPAS
jgi:hypothetical protein